MKGNLMKGKMKGHFRKGKKGTVHELEFIQNLRIEDLRILILRIWGYFYCGFEDRYVLKWSLDL